MVITVEREETYEKVYKVWKDNTGRELLSILWNENSGQSIIFYMKKLKIMTLGREVLLHGLLY